MSTVSTKSLKVKRVKLTSKKDKRQALQEGKISIKRFGLLNECDSKRVMQTLRNPLIVPDEKKDNILVTAALPYCNSVVHIGNIIGCVLSADVVARYLRMRGKNVLFICGTDEYGTATETLALKTGCTPKELCDKYFPIHKEVYNWFNISLDHFGRTTNKFHEKISLDIYNMLNTNNLISTHEMEQLYCNRCSRFVADRFVFGTCPRCKYEGARGDQCDKCDKHYDKVLNPKCIICREACGKKSTEHKFLELPLLKDRLAAWSSNVSHWSENAAALNSSYFESGLERRCITRNLNWGVRLDDSRIFYCWFDAPIGYISITQDYYTSEALTSVHKECPAMKMPTSSKESKEVKSDMWKSWWCPKAEDPKVDIYQFMGKDNIWFHSIMFPATLLGTNYGTLGKICPRIIATEHLQYGEGKKFSKTDRIGVFGDDAKNTGIPCDVWRFYLLYNRPETSDTVFSWNDLLVKNNELANELGNLIMRTITLYNANFIATDGTRTLNLPLDVSLDPEFVKVVQRFRDEYIALMDECKIKAALKKILELCREANRYFNDNKPWQLSKTNVDKFCTVLYTVLNTLYVVAHLMSPFLPDVADLMFDQLNLPVVYNFLHPSFKISNHIPFGHALKKPVPIIDILDKEYISKLEMQYGKT